MIWLLLAFVFLALADCLRTLNQTWMPWALLALAANIVCFTVFILGITHR